MGATPRLSVIARARQGPKQSPVVGVQSYGTPNRMPKERLLQKGFALPRNDEYGGTTEHSETAQ